MNESKEIELQQPEETSSQSIFGENSMSESKEIELQQPEETSSQSIFEENSISESKKVESQQPEETLYSPDSLGSLGRDVHMLMLANLSFLDVLNTLEVSTQWRKWAKEHITKLIKSGVNINMADKQGRTPLLNACENGHLKVVRFLLEHKADMTISRNNGWTPLMSAYDKGHLKVVRVLLKQNPDIINIPDVNGWTPLNSACYLDQLEHVRFLLTHNADITIPSDNGSTPLISACHNDHPDVVSELLKHNPDIINIPTDNGWTPLNIACEEGYLEVVRVLLNHNADTNIRNNNGWTPLNNACDKGYLEVVRVLLNHNADTNIPNYDGITPLYQACYDDRLDINDRLDIARLLLEHGADINIKYDGKTLLYTACESRNLEKVRFLLEHNADINIPKKYGITPLHSACNKEYLKIARILRTSPQHMKPFIQNALQSINLYIETRVKDWNDTLGKLQNSPLKIFTGKIKKIDENSKRYSREFTCAQKYKELLSDNNRSLIQLSVILYALLISNNGSTLQDTVSDVCDDALSELKAIIEAYLLQERKTINFEDLLSTIIEPIYKAINKKQMPSDWTMESLKREFPDKAQEQTMASLNREAPDEGPAQPQEFNQVNDDNNNNDDNNKTFVSR